jgi:hypothetical protein
MVRCDATASYFVAKVSGEVFAHFHSVALNVAVVCDIDCLICQYEFFVMTKRIRSLFFTLLFTSRLIRSR